MKKLLLLLIVPINLLAQNDNYITIGNYLEFTQNVEIIELEPSASYETLKSVSEPTTMEAVTFTIGKNEIIQAEVGWIFKILKNDKNIYVIKLIGQPDYANKFYGISKFQLINSAKLYDGKNAKDGFVASAITIPVKVRFGNEKSEPLAEGERERFFDFEGNYNIGITGGYRIRINQNGSNYLTGLVGFNIGSTKVTPETADVETDSNRSILTPFTGLMVEFSEFQIGAFVGWDHVSGQLSKSWVYQGKPWLGLGIGYNIFATEDSTPSN